MLGQVETHAGDGLIVRFKKEKPWENLLMNNIQVAKRIGPNVVVSAEKPQPVMY